MDLLTQYPPKDLPHAWYRINLGIRDQFPKYNPINKEALARKIKKTDKYKLQLSIILLKVRS